MSRTGGRGGNIEACPASPGQVSTACRAHDAGSGERGTRSRSERTLRILLHGINYHPETTSTGRYTGEMGRWLASRGHEVRVVTAPPYYPLWRVGKGYSGGRYAREVLDGAVVWRCPLWVPRRPSGKARIAHLASFASSSAPVMLGQARIFRPDVVVMVEPTLLCLPHSWAAARAAGAPLWVHVQDFELEAALGLGIMRAGAARGAFRAAEGGLFSLADRVSTISEAMRRRLVEKGVPEERTFLMPNWADLGRVRPARPDEEVRRVLGASPGDVLVLYTGSMGEKQGLGLVLDAAQRLRPEVRFALVGAGPARAALEKAARERGLRNVRFCDVWPEEDLPRLLAAGDIHLVVQRREAADLVMPSKLANILAAGRPAVATAAPGTELHRVVAGGGCGLVVPPEDAAALARGIADLAGDAALRERLGAAARRYAEERLDREGILSRFEAELARLAA